MCCIYLITHSSSEKFFQWQSHVLSLIFSDLKSELTLRCSLSCVKAKLKSVASLIAHSAQSLTKWGATTFWDRNIFSSFVTVIRRSHVSASAERNSLLNLGAEWMDSLTALLRNLIKVSFESTWQFLDKLSFDLFFSICSNAQTISFFLKWKLDLRIKTV